MLHFILTVSAALSVKPWAAPGPGEIRGPCPGLNTLANHGYIDRTGKNLRLEDLMENAEGVYALDNKLMTKLALETFAELNITNDILPSLASLTDVVHDVSLTRHDKGLGEYVKVDPALVDKFLAHSTDDKITPAHIVAGLKDQYHECMKNKPNCEFNGDILKKVAAETFSLFGLFADETMSYASKKEIESWLKNERLPDDFKSRKERFGQIINLDNCESAIKSIAIGLMLAVRPMEETYVNCIIAFICAFFALRRYL